MAEEIRNFQVAEREAMHREQLPSSPSTKRPKRPASRTGTTSNESQALLARKTILRLIEFFKA